MQVSIKLQSNNRAIFSLARLESTVALRAAWIFPFFSAVWRLFRKIVLLRYSPRVDDRVELKDIQIQCAMAKFYAKMRIGKVSTIGMLALLLAVVCRVNSCYVSNHTIIIFIAAALLLVAREHP